MWNFEFENIPRGQHIVAINLNINLPYYLGFTVVTHSRVTRQSRKLTFECDASTQGFLCLG